MKKSKKIMFALISIVASLSIVYASVNATYLINRTGTLSNVVNGNTTSRNKIEGEATFKTPVNAQMRDVNSVTGKNSEGGIRVKTIAKKTNLGIVTSTKEMYIPVHQTTTNSITATFTYNTSSNKLKITWEDWTGNTSFNAKFVAYNMND